MKRLARSSAGKNRRRRIALFIVGAAACRAINNAGGPSETQPGRPFSNIRRWGGSMVEWIVLICRPLSYGITPRIRRDIDEIAHTVYIDGRACNRLHPGICGHAGGRRRQDHPGDRGDRHAGRCRGPRTSVARIRGQGTHSQPGIGSRAINVGTWRRHGPW